MVQDIKYADIKVGDCATFTKTVSETDVVTFAGISGDFNPVHVNVEFAKQSLFGERVAHGILTASFISTVLGTTLPGANTLYLAQELKFTAPVKIGDTITAEVEVVEKVDAKKVLRLKTRCLNQHGQVVIDGVATVKKVEN